MPKKSPTSYATCLTTRRQQCHQTPQGEALAVLTAINRIDSLADALEWYAELLKKSGEARDRHHPQGKAEGFRDAAESIRAALRGEAPPLLIPEIARSYEELELELDHSAKG